MNNGNIDYDYCILDMPANIGALTGWMGIGTAPGGISNKFVTVSGYPEEDGNKYYQYWSVGYMDSTSDYRFDHNADTSD